jgi:hypothetical protein
LLTKRDYVYRVTVGNRGSAGTRVHSVRLEFKKGEIRMMGSVVEGASDPQETDLPAKDRRRWVYELEQLRRVGQPSGNPPTVKVRPVITWGPSREKKGRYRRVCVDPPKLTAFAPPGPTLTITPRPPEESEPPR